MKYVNKGLQNAEHCEHSSTVNKRVTTAVSVITKNNVSTPQVGSRFQVIQHIKTTYKQLKIEVLKPIG